MYLWATYRRFASRRGFVDGVPLPISYSEIYSYSQLTGTQLDPWEVGILVELDSHERNLLYTQINKQREAAKRG